MGNTKPARASEAGFSLVEFVVVVVVVSIMSAVLLERVKFYQEHAEKATMEATAAAVQAGMHLRMAGYLAAGRIREVQLLTTQNPIDWLARKPDNYAGAFDRLGAEEVPEGSWYFDLSDKTLVYRVRYGRAFVSDADGSKEVHYRAHIEYGRLGAGLDLMGIKTADFSPVHPYEWLID
jgi:prepilin-type N-terminal cleavage/methylation domain-containing protein